MVEKEGKKGKTRSRWSLVRALVKKKEVDLHEFEGVSTRPLHDIQLLGKEQGKTFAAKHGTRASPAKRATGTKVN